MNRSQIRRYLGYFIIIAVSIGVISIHAGTLFRRDAYNRTIGILERANTITGNLLFVGGFDSIDGFIRSIAVEDVRITVIRDDGVVVADSQAEITKLDNHGDRPEVFSALNGVLGSSKRYSDSLGKYLVYVASPMIELDTGAYVIRSSMSVDDIDEALGDIIRRIIITGIITFIALSGLSYLSERRLIAPFADIQKAAEAYSGGDLDHYLNIPGPEDIRIVAETLNKMAITLKSRLKEISKGKNELDAIFASMTEAVVVLDLSLNIRHLNNSALKLAERDMSEVYNRGLIEVLMNSELQALAEETLDSEIPIERIIRFSGVRTLVLQVHGTRIQPIDDFSDGNAVVLVMNDITKTQHLENMRRDFVANVSHELKTPITNIKGYLETLSDGSEIDPETAERFLKISVRNADRLNAILDDLLSLSRLEQLGSEGLDFESRILDGIVESAFQACIQKAAEKQISLHFHGDKEIRASINTLLMEQALTNLIDNAVKYSNEGTAVSVRIENNGYTTDISVLDTGTGIPAKDLPRIFERFYRVDKARSRDLGGTGLGLAIVKHIAIVHGGTVTVESELGKGCRFTISLPLNTAV